MNRNSLLYVLVLFYFASCGCPEEFIPYMDIPPHSKTAFVYQEKQLYKYKIIDSLYNYESNMLVIESKYGMQKLITYDPVLDCGTNDIYYKETYYAKLFDSTNFDSLEIRIFEFVDNDEYTIPDQNFRFSIIYNGKHICDQRTNWIESAQNSAPKIINGISYNNVYTVKAFQNSNDTLNTYSFNGTHGVLEVKIPKFSLSLIQ